MLVFFSCFLLRDAWCMAAVQRSTPSRYAGCAAQAAGNKAKRAVATPVYGVGPTTQLEALERVFKVARIFMAIGLLAALCGAAPFFLAASWGVVADIKCARTPCPCSCGRTTLWWGCALREGLV